MKAFVVGGILAFLLAFIVTVEAAEFEITSSELSFGGLSTHKQEQFAKTITIKNNLPLGFHLENFVLDFSTRNDFRQSNVQINETPEYLNNSQSQGTINVIVRPEDFDAIDSQLRKRGVVDIGSLAIKADKVDETTNARTSIMTNQITLRLEIKNDLDLTSVDIIKDDVTKSISADSTFTITVDEDYDLKFKVKNLFDTSSNIELENIKITITSDDFDLDKSTSISEILAGKEGEKTISISVDKAKTGDVTIKVEGDDKWGGKHGDTFSFRFKVEEAEEEEETSVDDSDGDGVPDATDECLNTVSVCDVDAVGCPIDSDEDGTCDALDPTPKPEKKIQRATANEGAELASQSEEEKQESKTTQEKKQEEENTEETSGFIPFLIGFVIGILVTAGFSVLIKS